jgi:predicted DNA-binding transcriptional regulator AlpA
MPVHIDQSNSKHPRSVDAFCDRNGICKATFYNLLKQNRGPRVMKIGTRTLITEAAEADWQRQMEGRAA